MKARIKFEKTGVRSATDRNSGSDRRIHTKINNCKDFFNNFLCHFERRPLAEVEKSVLTSEDFSTPYARSK